MGLRAWLGLPEPTSTVDAALSPLVSQVPPGVAAHLLTLAGYQGTDLINQVTRDTALKVPALNAGVRLITAVANQLPLSAASTIGEPSYETVTWLGTLDPDLPRGWTIAKTVDSIIFYGTAYWVVKERWSNGFPKASQWVDPYRVRVEPTTGHVWVDGELIDPADLIQFYGLTEGILTTGSEAIAAAAANIRQVRRYAENPAPAFHLVDAEGVEPLEADQARDFLQALNDAVRTRGTAYLAGLRIEQMGWNARELQLLEARQHDAVEMARLLNLDPTDVGAPQQGSTLTYQNAQDRARARIDAMSAYLLPITTRLSLPDVTPRGTTVSFDAASFYLQVTPDQPTQGALL